MSEDAASWQSDLFGILHHPTETRILLVRDREEWSLPHARLMRGIWLDKLGIVSGELSRALSRQVRAFRYVHYERDKEQSREEGIYLLEWVGQPEMSPPAGQWIDRQGAAALALSHPEHRAVIDEYFQEIASGVVPERRQPWAQPGWFDEAAAWIAARLADRDAAVIAPIEQARNWSLSCVLRARTTTGNVYFKTATETALFVNEPVVVEGLARLYPAHIPAPLAIDAERRWMLLPDFGEPLGWDAPLEAREALLCAYGKVQLAAARQPERLLELGCIDRRLDRLIAQIDPLLADPDVLIGLDDGEVAHLHAVAPRLKAICAELATYRLPQTLVHGDLHGGNTALRDGTPIFFDWTDACLGHPFFDLMTLLYQEEAVEVRLRDAYLALWTDYEPPERLLAAWALARPLCALHQAVSYQAIMASLEARTRRENSGDAGEWLRRMLKAMPG